MKLLQPLLLPGTADHGGVIKGQLPAGQHRGRFPEKCGKLLGRPPGGHVILADQHQGPVKFPVQARHQMAPVDLAQAGDGGGFLPGDGFQKKLIFGDVF